MHNVFRIGGKLNLVGDVLEETRLLQNMSREELAQRVREYHIPMTRCAIYRIEKGERRISIYEFAALSKILSLDYNQIDELIQKRLCAIRNKE